MRIQTMRKFGQPKDLKKFKTPTPKSEANLPSEFIFPNQPIIPRFTSDANKLTVTGYMCAINWQYELGQNAHGIEVYRSIDDLQANHDCWEECGIVEVQVTIKKTIAPGQY
jgi:hypothetical protein